MSQQATTHRLEVDSSKCQGHGRCYTIAPGIFDADDEGYSIVRVADISSDQWELADRTVHECPEQAISLSGEKR